MSDIAGLVERLRHCSENTADEYLRELTGRAADALEAFRWRSVNDEPPEDGWVIACGPGLVGASETRVWKGCFYDPAALLGLGSDYGEKPLTGVTRWMPLPEPPDA